MSGPVSKIKTVRLQREFLYPFLLTFALSLFLPALAHAAPQDPQLVEKVSVEGQFVTLADLFANAGIKGSTAVFRSPEPGTTGKVSVRRILSAAKTHGLRISYKPVFTMVAIKRTSRVIELGEFEDLIRNRLEGRQTITSGNGQLVIKLPENLKKIHVDPLTRGELSLSSLDWSARSGRFTARFALNDSDPIVLKGTASLMMKVAVARSGIERGKILADNDIEMKFINSANARKKFYTGSQDMIGLSTRRSIQAGKPINISDLEPPKLIHKNQLVTILLEVPGLILRTEGKALADATKGDTVRILNTQSKRIIHATAIASGLVSVKLVGSNRSGS